MRYYETQERVVKDKMCTKVVCDLCGKEGKSGAFDESGQYNVNETELIVTVRQKQGYAYDYEGGSGTEVIIDMCPSCFRDRLIPWIRSQGGTVTEHEWGW